MISTNALEYAAGVWGGTYLAKAHGFSASKAASALALYYAGLALSRFVSGVLSKHVKTWARIGIGSSILLSAVVIMLLPLPDWASVLGLALVGLGNGSIYPNLIHLTPHNFGKETAQSVMGSLIAFAYVGVMIAPPLVGFFTDAFDMKSYPFILLGIFVMKMSSLAIFILQLKKHNKFDKTI